jgi:TRAP-type C4-dicarboxylate transport system permease large subunit
MLVLSSAVVLPMVQSAGIDLLWFGVYMVILIEMAQITPPVGFNLFVLQSMAGRDIWQVTRAALPFFLLLVFAVFLITVFPQIVTFLPQVMMSSR